MENVNIILFILLLVLIPFGMLLAGINDCRKQGAYFPTILVKCFGASVIHLIISVLAAIAFYLVNAVITSSQVSGQDKISAQTVALFITFVYAFFGWLLCSFVGGKFVRSMNDLGFSAKK